MTNQLFYFNDAAISSKATSGRKLFGAATSREDVRSQRQLLDHNHFKRPCNKEKFFLRLDPY